MNDFEKNKQKKIIYSFSQAVEKARHWCALQERSHHETRLKIGSLGIYSDEAEQLVSQLITEGFLNEERFAKAFARGKFRIKHWGKIKIISELKRKKISEYCINKGLEEIDDNEYFETIYSLIKKKNIEIKEHNPWKRKAKLISFLAGKGYEMELVREILYQEEMDNK